MSTTISVESLIKQLEVYRDCEISFGGLEFMRLKLRDDHLVMMEFNQPVYINKEGKVVVENLDFPDN